MKDSNREAFESWATDKFPIAGLGQFEKHNNGTYLQRSIRNMYEAWQAAKSQAVPEGLIDQLESTANFMRGMCFDPRLHHAIREAVLNHVEQIEAEIEAQGSAND